jgi:hypothetical protein
MQGTFNKARGRIQPPARSASLVFWEGNAEAVRHTARENSAPLGQSLGTARDNAQLRDYPYRPRPFAAGPARHPLQSAARDSSTAGRLREGQPCGHTARLTTRQRERQPSSSAARSTTFDFGVSVSPRLAHANRAYVKCSLRMPLTIAGRSLPIDVTRRRGPSPTRSVGYTG